MQQVRLLDKPLSPMAPYNRPIYLSMSPLWGGVQLLCRALCPPRGCVQVLRGCGCKRKKTAVVAVLSVEHTRVELVTF